MNDWDSMTDRQEAGKKFLVFLIRNPKERDAVLAHPAYAREVFQRESGMKLPPQVQMYAVADERPARDDFNVILIPERDPDPDPLKYWIAAWIPYGPQQPRADAKKQK